MLFSGCTSTNAQAQTPTVSATPGTESQTVIPATSSDVSTPLLVTTTAATAAVTSVVPVTTTQVNSPVIVTLNSARKTSILGTYKPNTGNIFLVLDITIKNTDTSEDFEYSSTSFTLYDKPNSKKYTPITEKVSGSLTNPIVSGKVPMKSEKTGQIVFGVVDMGTKGYKFSVTDSSGTEIASFTNFLS